MTTKGVRIDSPAQSTADIWDGFSLENKNNVRRSKAVGIFNYMNVLHGQYTGLSHYKIGGGLHRYKQATVVANGCNS